MTVWIVRGGEDGQREEFCLQKGFIIIGWREFQLDLATVPNQSALRELMEKTYPPETKPDRVSNFAGQVYRFVNNVVPGDYVVMPRKGKDTAAVGRVTGEYEYRPDFGTENTHGHPVDWLEPEARRSSLPAAVTDTLRGAAGTVTRVKDSDAHARMDAFVREGPSDSLHMPRLHLLLRWSHEENPTTVVLHKEVADSHGSVWWGKLGDPAGRRALQESNLARLRKQLGEGVKTNVYLYRSGEAWRTRLLDVTTNRSDVEDSLVPEYYGPGPHHLWLHLTDFEQLEADWPVRHLVLDSDPSKRMGEAFAGQSALFLVRDAAEVIPTAATSAAGVFDLATLKTVVSEFGLRLDDSVLASVVAALRARKHVILTGPPGTAKTTLAQALGEVAKRAGMCRDYVLTTATADWTTYETIGGLRPTTSNELVFSDGHLLATIRQGHWLIIDELNRSNFDRAFGQLFTVLSGQPVTLPYEDAASHRRISIVPEGVMAPKGTQPVLVPESWRLVATMNVFDKSLLFEMSYALMRRFAFIEVGPPAETVYLDLVRQETDNDDVSVRVVRKLLPLRAVKELGPAMFMDIGRYIVERQTVEPGVSEQQLVFESFYSYLLPQFEGVDERGGTLLYRTLAGQVPDSSRLKNVLVDVLGLEEGRLTGAHGEVSPLESESSEALEGGE